MTRRRHSERIERTNLSAYAFKFGLFTGNFTVFHAGSGENRRELFREQRIPIVDQIPCVPQESLDRIGQVPEQSAPSRRRGRRG